jgi:hypothetical protein
MEVICVTYIYIYIYIYSFIFNNPVVGRDNSVDTATRYGQDCPEIEFRYEARFFAPVQTGLGAHPAPYTVFTGSFSGLRRPGRCIDHPLHLAPTLKKEELYIYSASVPSWPVLG